MCTCSNFPRCQGKQKALFVGVLSEGDVVLYQNACSCHTDLQQSLHFPVKAAFNMWRAWAVAGSGVCGSGAEQCTPRALPDAAHHHHAVQRHHVSSSPGLVWEPLRAQCPPEGSFICFYPSSNMFLCNRFARPDIMFTFLTEQRCQGFNRALVGGQMRWALLPLNPAEVRCGDVFSWYGWVLQRVHGGVFFEEKQC